MTYIYTATVKSATGREFAIAVESTDINHRRDLRTVAQIVTGLPLAAIRLHDVAPIPASETGGWQAIRQCIQNGSHWAWCDAGLCKTSTQEVTQ